MITSPAPKTEVKEASERVYALDALRAAMMLLGIVLHASITYGAIDYQEAWPLKDSSTSPLFDLVVVFIHTFRMPVFFVAAGYFGSLLFYKKGPRAMLLNRFRRIVLPFVAGVLVISPLISAALAFTQTSFANSSPALTAAVDTLIRGNFLPLRIAHLWFLYFLIMYALLGWSLGILFKKKTNFTVFIYQAFSRIFQIFWLRIISMAVALFLCLYWMKSPFILTNNQWSVDPATFVIYFVFFGTGWMLYKTNCLQNLTQYPILQLSIATLLFLVASLTPWPTEPWALTVQQGLNALHGSLFIFGFITFFTSYFNSYSPRLTYIMDSAYWVYIIHMPIVVFVPGLMAGSALPIFIKFAITFSVTTIICFATYQSFVRGSFIGMFLNGKVYKKDLARSEAIN
ncbi:acyltransferase family protein [Chryseolinea sp. T2]|uniref:acyltransferase family protein n=1 Tax=Chryseolinea sp. T2 TaxID=3129255 RepID=UPI00307813BF